MLLVVYTVLALSFLFSFVSSSSNTLQVPNENLSAAETDEIMNAYNAALNALKADDLDELVGVLETRATLVQLAFHHNLAPNSLLYLSLYTKYQNFRVYEILARYGVEVGGTSAFRLRMCHGYNSVESESDEDEDDETEARAEIQAPSLSLLKSLVDLNLITLEDLWSEACMDEDCELFHWLVAKGANVNYRIPFFNQTVIFCCYIFQQEKKFDFLLGLGVDVNVEPDLNHIYENFWDIVASNFYVFSRGSIVNIVKDTRELFSPFNLDTRYGFYSSKFEYNCDHELVDSVLSAELRRRKENGSFDLSKYDSIDMFGWTLLDRVGLRAPGCYPETVAFLREYGLAVNLPLSHAYYYKDWSRLRELIESGRVNYNEQPSRQESILAVLIADERIEVDLIEKAIDRGARVNFADEAKDPNAFFCVAKYRPGQVSLLTKIWYLLNVKEQIECLHPKPKHDCDNAVKNALALIIEHQSK